MPDTGELFPLTNDEVRRRRLKQLALEVGGVKVIAAHLEPDPQKQVAKAQNLDHILSRRKSSHKRADKSQAVVSVGDSLARALEQAFEKAPGWMDWPFLNVPYEPFANLGGTGRALVEGAMINALAQVEKLPDVVRQADKQAVTNKKVEEHYKALPQGAAEAAWRKASAAVRVNRPDPHGDLFTTNKDKAP